MDIRKLSDADKYLLYGLLLRKKRPPGAEVRVMEIMRAPLSLDQKIDAILALHRGLSGGEAGDAQEQEEAAAELGRGPPPAQPARGKRRLRAVVADPFPEVTRLLAKSSLRWDLEFVQSEDARQALNLVRRLRARLVVCNLPLNPGEREQFARECRSRQARVRVIFLASPEPGMRPPDPALQALYRVLSKPINLNQVGEAVRELLEG